MGREIGKNEIVEDKYLISVGTSKSIDYSSGDKKEGHTVYVMDLDNKEDFEFVGDKGPKLFDSIDEAIEAGRVLLKKKWVIKMSTV